MTSKEKLLKEEKRIFLMGEKERELGKGASFIFGIDEAGRGPLAGPVTAACVIFPADTRILWLNDSKKLSAKKRDELFPEIIDRALAYGISGISEKDIDETDILSATFLAMRHAFEASFEMLKSRILEKLPSGGLPSAFDLLPGLSDTVVLVDGNKTVCGISFPQKNVVHGDSICPSIAAASILAKVTRDRLMEEYDSLYPEYGFSRNKGYGTSEHIEAIRRYGPSKIHRMSFLGNIL